MLSFLPDNGRWSRWGHLRAFSQNLCYFCFCDWSFPFRRCRQTSPCFSSFFSGHCSVFPLEQWVWELICHQDFVALGSRIKITLIERILLILITFQGWYVWVGGNGLQWLNVVEWLSGNLLNTPHAQLLRGVVLLGPWRSKSRTWTLWKHNQMERLSPKAQPCFTISKYKTTVTFSWNYVDECFRCFEPVIKMQTIEVLEHATRQYLIHVVSEDKQWTVCLGMICLWGGFIHILGACLKADYMSHSAIQGLDWLRTMHWEVPTFTALMHDKWPHLCRKRRAGLLGFVVLVGVSPSCVCPAGSLPCKVSQGGFC